VDGKVVSDPGPLAPGKQMQVILKGTEIESIVISKNEHHGNEFNI